jgi:hypothetical protein
MAAPLDGGRPVLVAVDDLRDLALEVRHLLHRRTFLLDRHRVGNGERRHTARTRPDTGGGGGPGHDHEQIGTETADLLLHRRIGALADAHGRDDRRHADDAAEHRQG